ncbi:MAG: hypothetical protein QM811_06475 [Pirellulales bacterium]
MGSSSKPVAGTLPHGLPTGTESQRIAFVTERSPEQELVLEFPPVIQRRAIVVKHARSAGSSDLTRELEILTIPTAAEADVELLEYVRNWVEADAGDAQPRGQMMTLQGARIFWSRGRIAIFAAVDRIPTIRRALIENAYYEAELHDLEQRLGESWPQLEADMPLAFEFDERSLDKRKSLRRNFQNVMMLRARLARITPFVHCPHLHPPTLASQVEDAFANAIARPSVTNFYKNNWRSSKKCMSLADNAPATMCSAQGAYSRVDHHRAAGGANPLHRVRVPDERVDVTTVHALSLDRYSAHHRHFHDGDGALRGKPLRRNHADHGHGRSVVRAARGGQLSTLVERAVGQREK